MISKLQLVVIIFLLAVISIFAYRNYQLRRQLPENWPRTFSNKPSPSPFVRTGLPSDWQTFTNFKNLYTFKYPSDVNVEEFQENVRVAQKDLGESTAGIFIDFRLEKLPAGVDLQTYLEQQIQIAEVGGEITNPLTPMLVNSYESFMYSYKGLGEEKHYYILRFDSETLMHIINATADAPDRDYKGTADNIVQTFAFTQ